MGASRTMQPDIPKVAVRWIACNIDEGRAATVNPTSAPGSEWSCATDWVMG